MTPAGSAPIVMRSIAFTLLLSLALGLWAGPHLCHAGEAAAAGRTMPAAHGSAPAGQAVSLESPAPCHGGAAHPAAAAARTAPATLVEAGQALAHAGGAPASRDCCCGGGSPCEQACSTVAVLRAAAPVPARLAAEELPAASAVASPSCLSFPIDHVPLS